MGCKVFAKTQNVPVKSHQCILDLNQSITSATRMKRHFCSQRCVLRFKPSLKDSPTTGSSYSPACRNWAPVWTIAVGLSPQILFISKYLIPCAKAASGWARWPGQQAENRKSRGAAAICGPHAFPQQAAAAWDAAWAAMQPANCQSLLIYSTWSAGRKKRISFRHSELPPPSSQFRMTFKVELEQCGPSTAIDSRHAATARGVGLPSLLNLVNRLEVRFLCWRRKQECLS